jgi:L-alanine-DL-glutamate epimerase-like enolase superfamily enzyme
LVVRAGTDRETASTRDPLTAPAGAPGCSAGKAESTGATTVDSPAWNAGDAGSHGVEKPVEPPGAFSGCACAIAKPAATISASPNTRLAHLRTMGRSYTRKYERAIKAAAPDSRPVLNTELVRTVKPPIWSSTVDQNWRAARLLCFLAPHLLIPRRVGQCWPMKPNRRDLFKIGAAAAAATCPARAADPALSAKLERIMAAPVLRTDILRDPLKVEKVELLRAGNHYIVRVRGGGLEGYSDAHSSVMSAAYPILVKKVAPNFVGKDARQLESVFHEAYLAGSNYKWQGLPFWVSMAVVEIAILDLLGKAAGKPLGELFGPVLRRDIAVYRASGNRGNSPEAEIAAIKFRLGARMLYNDASTKRELALIPLTRKTFGSKMAIYADANGSYDVPMAIRIGRLMEEQKFGFFEEPVPFDYYDEIKRIADTLDIRIALGEEEMSMRGFRRIIETGTAQVIQPDILYGGGMMRAIKVARMANAAGLECTPHMSGGGLGFLYVAHFASCVADPGPHQEYKGEDDNLPVASETSSLKSEKGMLKTPTGPGLGVSIDPALLKTATVVTG